MWRTPPIPTTDLIKCKYRAKNEFGHKKTCTLFPAYVGCLFVLVLKALKNNIFCSEVVEERLRRF